LEGRILKLPLDKGNRLKEGSWGAYQMCGWCVFFEARGNKGGEGVCEKKHWFLCVKKGCSWKKCLQIKSMEGDCV
jgi:hypothetical protein